MTCKLRTWGQEFTPEEIKDARDNNTLLSMELELSRICNMRCIYCYSSAGDKLNDELSLDEIKDIIDQAALLKAKKIIVLGGGEPLLYPYIFQVLEHIKKREMEPSIFTNGVAIDKDTAKNISKLQCPVVIKCNSMNTDIQDRLSGQKGAYDAIKSGMENLMAQGYPDAKHLLGIQSIICSLNIKELPEMWRWARKHNISPYFETITWQGRACEHSFLEVSPEELQELFEEICNIDMNEFGYNWTPHPPLIGSSCSRHEYSCTVTSTGDVVPCPGVDLPVGNIRDKSLSDILSQSSVINDLRQIRKNIKGACKGCELLDECYGCRGMAYQVNGDYLAEDPLCWCKKEILKKAAGNAR